MAKAKASTPPVEVPVTAAAVIPAKTYPKEQLVRSKRYLRFRDLLTALLRDGERYTFDQVDTVIDQYMKRMVK